jgi:hypothetical protein
VPDPARDPNGRPLLLAAVFGALIVVPFLLRLALLERRVFGNDEFEHLHFAWSVSQGQVPYRDYFDHHTPALQYLLAPMFRLFRVETSSADAVSSLFFARRLTWVLASLALAATWALGRRWRGPAVAWAGTLLLANTWVFLAKTIEVRPDVPSTGTVLAGLLLALSGWRRLAHGRRGAGARMCASGALFGLAVLFTQKAVFLLAGVALAEAWLLASRHVQAPRAARLGAVAAQATGFFLPIAATLGYFAAQGALRAFYECNVLVNARWPGLGPRAFVLRFLGDEPAFAGLALLGLAASLRTLARPEAIRAGEPLLALALIAPAASLAVHPAVTFHYFLLFLPQAALYAGAALVALGRLLARGRGKDLALAGLAVLVSLGPLVRFARMFQGSNYAALEGVREVIRNSAPWETTLDGFSGLGLYRPAAFYHPHQHWHTLAIQTEAQRRHLAEALRSGAVMPKLVFWDDGYLRDGLPPAAGAFVERHYVPAGVSPVYVRLFDNGLGFWTDEGPRPLGWVKGQERAPHVIVGEGWRDPGLVDGVPARRTRTRSSSLRLPVRDPADVTVTLRARADREALPFHLELLVNGVSAGRAAAEPRWHDYVFPVRAPGLRRGLNDVLLRYPGAAADRRPELAVATIALTRVRPVADGVDSRPSRSERMR